LRSIRSFLAAWTATLPLSMKLSVAFAATLLLGVLGLAVFAHQRARKQAIAGELATLVLLSERLAGQVDTYLSTTRGLAGHLALTQDLERFLSTRQDPRAMQAFHAWLDLQARGTAGLSAVFVMGPDGTCLASSNRPFVGRNFGFRPYFQEAMAGTLHTTDWFIGSVTKTPRVSTAAPVRVGGRIAGVLVTEFDVEELERMVRSFGQGNRSAVLINRLGIALTHSDGAHAYQAMEPIPPEELEALGRTRQFLGRAFPQAPLSSDFVAAFHRVAREGQPRTVRYRLGGHLKWGALSPVRQQAWIVTVSAPEADILLPTRAVWKETLLVGLLSSGGAFLLGLGLMRLLLRPLRDLSSAITTFGRGDLSARAPLQTHRELDQVASTFNTMADTIQVHQEHLEAIVQARTRDLEQALSDVKTLQGMIPICSYCKKIRDDGGSWWQMESYIQSHSEAEFSHGICPDCRRRHFPGSPPGKPSGS
jgi:C4-dicarboxylate-specific signal transduction histidine kinase